MRIKQEINNGVSLGLYDKDKLVGFILGGQLRNYKLTRTLFKEDEWDYIYIDAMAIMKEYQNRGYGKKMLKKLLGELKDERFKGVITHTSNPHMIRLLIKLGFIDEGQDALFNGLKYRRLMKCL